MFAKIREFFKSKVATAVNNNISVEDQYNRAADLLIEQIAKLQKRHVTSITEEKRLKALAAEKNEAAKSKERDIIHLRKTQPNTDLTTHVKLALLYKSSGEQLIKKAEELKAMRAEIESSVVQLDDSRKDLAVKLEFIRESKAANALGLSTADDVIELAGLTKVDIDTILMRVDTFKGEGAAGVETATSADVAEYLAAIDAQIK
ncbi:hypothetical protein [Yersinia phage MHG19]|nr:hypothetical protein [Yersinia phage MHG19]